LFTESLHANSVSVDPNTHSITDADANPNAHLWKDPYGVNQRHQQRVFSGIRQRSCSRWARRPNHRSSSRRDSFSHLPKELAAKPANTNGNTDFKFGFDITFNFVCVHDIIEWDNVFTVGNHN
jgi:hypothetical protein